MTNLTKGLVCCIFAVTLIAAALLAQDKKSASKILQPQMTVETGSYSAPAATLGEKPAQPWSSTTIGASVDGKPNPGATITTKTGEIVDFSCYLEVGKHGDKHRDCAQKCFRNGQPIGLLTQDGALYMLMEEEHDPRRDGLTDFRQAAIDHAGHIVQVSGTEWSLNGYHALYIHGYLKK